MVAMEYTLRTVLRSPPPCTIPMISPATKLMTVMIRDITASPLTILVGAIHGAIKVRLPLDLLPAQTGLFLIDQARAQIRVNSHLFSRHSVQGEPGSYLGDPFRPLGDDNELDQYNDQKDQYPDDDISLGDQIPERLNDHTGVSPVLEDQTGEGHI